MYVFMYVKCQKVGPAVRAHYLMYQSFQWKLVFIMSIYCRPSIRTTTSPPPPPMFSLAALKDLHTST